jgi:N-acetylneuraminate synthase
MKIEDLFEKNEANFGMITKPYLIAEAGVNHEGQIDIAKRLIREAKEGGAEAIKFQSYKAEKLASKNSPSYWDLNSEPTKNQYELFKKYDAFGEDEFKELKRYCDAIGIEFLSTPFDIDSADYLNDLMKVYKISSSDITNKPFIEYICKFKKPIILSVGASTLSEIQDAKIWIDINGNPLALLHCVLNYPTSDANAYLGKILALKTKFPQTIVGYSDHTLPHDMKILEIATLLGARILEKHFTHDKTLPGNDHFHSMDKEDLKFFYQKMDYFIKVFGKNTIDFLPEEEPARRNARRSLVASRNIERNKIIDKNDLTWKRPAFGISPKFFDKIVGKTALSDIKEDTVITWEMVK